VEKGVDLGESDMFALFYDTCTKTLLQAIGNNKYLGKSKNK